MTHDTIYIKLFGEFSVWVNGQPVPLDNCTTKAMRVLQFCCSGTRPVFPATP